MACWKEARKLGRADAPSAEGEEYAGAGEEGVRELAKVGLIADPMNVTMVPRLDDGVVR
jgi:hypothetical protein